jgi:cystathionine beta-lyase/cystathionine gamma-synthase
VTGGRVDLTVVVPTYDRAAVLARCLDALRAQRVDGSVQIVVADDGSDDGTAELLAARDDLAGVRYPGRASDPTHDMAARQMTRFGSVVAFDLETRERADRFLAESVLITAATSFGGVHSSAERRGRWEGNDVGEGFVRLSVGCETPADLLADIERALDRSA